MGKKLTGKALAKFEAERDVKVTPESPVAQVRLKSGLSQADFAAVLGVSKRTLEQWEQGRREPSGAAKTLLRIADRHPEVLLEVA
jgi:putative transcriptional regulator